MNNQSISTWLSNLKLFGFLIAFAGSAFSRSVSEAGLGIYLFFFLFERIFFRKKTVTPFPQSGLLVVFFGSLLISLFISHYFWISVKGFWKYSSGFFIFYAGVDSLRTAKELRGTLWFIGIVYLVSALAGIIQGITGQDFIYRRAPIMQADMVRITGAFKHYNDYATFLVPGFALALALFLDSGMRRKKIEAFLSGALLLTLSYALLQTASRGALLGAICSFLVFIFFSRPSKKMLVVALIFILLAGAVPSPMRTRLKNVFNLQGEGTPERILLMKICYSMIRENPLFGLGINTYSDNFSRFKPKDYPGAMYAHNSYLQIAAEIGLVGIFLYLLFIASLLRTFIYRLSKNKDDPARIFLLAAIAGIIGILVNALSESLLQSTQLRMMFWWFVGLAGAIAFNIIQRKSSDSPGKRFTRI